MEPTQAPPDRHEPAPEPPVPGFTGPPGPTTPQAPVPAAPPGEDAEAISPQRGLLAWVVLIAAGSLLCALLGHPEVALLFAGAGMFALAQATDAASATPFYRHWVRESFPEGTAGGAVFRLVVGAIVPGAGALLYLGLGSYAWELGDQGLHRFAAVWSFAAAAVSLLLVPRSIADRVTGWMFRTGPIGRTRRLTARLVVLGLLLPVPMQAMFPDLLDIMRESPGPLVDAGGLVAQLLGEVALALAGVGWLVRRRWPGTRERLGLGGVRLSYAGVILAGLVGAIAVNAGMEALQRNAFPELYRQDQEVTRLIAGQMSVGVALLLGLSAGLGEELALRGALQPRLGVVLTAVLFACGHVQYSWFGMLTIALLGMLLGLVRRQTNTTTAIVVHMLYDVFAVLGSQG